MRRVLVDYNMREFVRPGIESIAVLESLNPELATEWTPMAGEEVMLFDHDGEEIVGRVNPGERFLWVVDLPLS